MNDAEALLEVLKDHYKVGTYRELAKKLGVAWNTVSGWKSRNAVSSIRKRIYELDIPIDTMQYVSEVKGRGVGINNGDVNHGIKNSKSPYQEKFDKLLMIARGTDNLDILDECLVECKKKIIKRS